MVNTLFLPELREMLREQNDFELREFCSALHPARTAEFMLGLEPHEMWQVLQYAEPNLRAEIFSYFPWETQLGLLEGQESQQTARLIACLPADDAVDLLQELPEQRVEELLALIPAGDRHDIRKLQSFKEGTAGALMTTEAACIAEEMTVGQALEALSKQAERLETIYYLYVIDDQNHLRGVVSNRQLVSSLGRPKTPLKELMESDVITCQVNEDQQSVASKVAKYDLLAIPVVDQQRHLLGIITHDDIIDVLREEAAEEMQRIAAVNPLRDTYARTSILTLSWKRGMWLTILFITGLTTAFALRYYDAELEKYAWLVSFIPLLISTGGNSGSQSATLVITGMATGDIHPRDWWRVAWREIQTGFLLGGFLGVVGYLAALIVYREPRDAVVIPVTILVVVACSTLIGSMLPLLFKKLNFDPALMSNPFVAGIMDILGIVIYINVAMVILG
jgi:magnesium transporter